MLTSTWSLKRPRRACGEYCHEQDGFGDGDGDNGKSQHVQGATQAGSQRRIDSLLPVVAEHSQVIRVDDSIVIEIPIVPRPGKIPVGCQGIKIVNVHVAIESRISIVGVLDEDRSVV